MKEEHVRDRAGRPLPAAPVTGLRVTVEDPRDPARWASHRVQRVTRRAFSVARRGKVERWPIEDWPRWLAACAAEGALVIHLPGCASPACAGCDGSALGRDPAEARRRARTPEEAHARDARLLPAARALLARDALTPLGDLDGLRRVEVRDGPRRYEVRVDPAWGAAPSCACPEARRPGSTTPCPHAIAVLLSDDELRCQLLEVFL